MIIILENFHKMKTNLFVKHDPQSFYFSRLSTKHDRMILNISLILKISKILKISIEVASHQNVDKFSKETKQLPSKILPPTCSVLLSANLDRMSNRYWAYKIVKLKLPKVEWKCQVTEKNIEMICDIKTMSWIKSY